MHRMAPLARSRTGLRRLGVAGLALICGAALTACGQAQPGVAAEIDGQEHSAAEVQTRTAEFFASYPEAVGSADPELVAAFTVENWLRGRVVDKIGRAFDLEPTQGDLEAIVERDFESMANYTQAVANLAVPASRPDLV